VELSQKLLLQWLPFYYYSCRDELILKVLIITLDLDLLTLHERLQQ